jgi:hypothetical protein
MSTKKLRRIRPPIKAKDRWDVLRGNLPSLREVASPELTPDDFGNDKVRWGYGEYRLNMERLKTWKTHRVELALVPMVTANRVEDAKTTVAALLAVANDKFSKIGNFESVFRPRKDSLWIYIKTVVFYLMLPAGCIAAILFYFFENPHIRQGSGKLTPRRGCPRGGCLICVLPC